MEALISYKYPQFSKISFYSAISRFNFRFLAPKSPIFRRKRIWSSKKRIFVTFSSSSASNVSNFGGWDDLESQQGPNQSGEFDRFRNFMISMGIDDRKHVFLFLIGFVSALAISRVRISSIAVVPGSILVFIVGFSIGLVRSGSGSASVIRNGILDFPKSENWRNLRDFLSELDSKVSKLKVGLGGLIESNHVEISELKKCYEIVESLRLGISENQVLDLKGKMRNAQSFDNASADDDQEVESNSNQKTSKRKKELGLAGFDFVQVLFRGLFEENFVGLKPHKANDIVKQESTGQSNSIEGNNRISVDTRNGSVLANIVEEKDLNAKSNNNVGNVNKDLIPQASMDNPTVNGEPVQDMSSLNKNVSIASAPKVYGSGLSPKKSKVLPQEVDRDLSKMALSDQEIYGNTESKINGKQFSHSRNESFKDDMFPLCDDFTTKVNDLQFSNKYGNFSKLSHQNQYEALATQNEVSHPAGLGASQDNGNFSHGLKEESTKTNKLQEQTTFNDQRCVSDMEVSDGPSSSPILDDEEFSKHLKEANGLLKQAKECLTGQVDEEKAEILLYNSESLLSRALRMNPTSLSAVGQLGNTFLLHGELKLKKSRELRALISNSASSSNLKGTRARSERLKYQVFNKDKVTSDLVDVCEECEKLLIEAGRKYRMALSINGNDIRALYNWGLALFFRAQLIADIGPDAALDADKIYLAAIDKFDAMVSKSNAYAPDALLRWGVTLQYRSHLRLSNSSEKLKLLYQAKRLLEDALYMDCDNPQVREALSSCISEINSRYL